MNRKLIAGGMFVGALCWVGLASLLSGGLSTASSIPAKDGSEATIKYLDKSKFESSETGEISLRMDVLDGKGQSILGLDQDRFEVKEDGKPVKLKAFNGPGTKPIHVILCVDISGSMEKENKMDGARDAALAAINHLKLDRDWIGVIAFDDKVDVLQPLALLTKDVKASCRAEINKLKPRGGTTISTPTLVALTMFWGRMLKENAPGVKVEKTADNKTAGKKTVDNKTVDDKSADKKTSNIKTLDIKTPDDKSLEGPKMVMVMTDGEDNALGPRIKKIAKTSEAAGVPVYTISFGQDVPAAILNKLAVECGGKYYAAPDSKELEKIYRERLEEMASEFLLVYDSPSPKPEGPQRKVEVKVTTKAGTLVATDKYRVGSIMAGGARRATGQGDDPSDQGGLPVPKLVLFLILVTLLGCALWIPSRRRLKSGTGQGPPPITPGTTSGTGMAIPPPPPPGQHASRPRIQPPKRPS